MLGCLISSHGTHECEDQHDRLQQAATVCCREESEQSKEQGNYAHAKCLNTRTDTYCKQLGMMRFPEHVSVNEFLARLFDCILCSSEFVAKQDHRNHTSEQENIIKEWELHTPLVMVISRPSDATRSSGSPSHQW